MFVQRTKLQDGRGLGRAGVSASPGPFSRQESRVAGDGLHDVDGEETTVSAPSASAAIAAPGRVLPRPWFPTITPRRRGRAGARSRTPAHEQAPGGPGRGRSRRSPRAAAPAARRTRHPRGNGDEHRDDHGTSLQPWAKRREGAASAVAVVPAPRRCAGRGAGWVVVGVMTGPLGVVVPPSLRGRHPAVVGRRVVSGRSWGWARVIPPSDSATGRPAYCRPMTCARLGQVADALLASALACVMTVELVVWSQDEVVAAVAAGLLAVLPLALRARTRWSPSCSAMTASSWSAGAPGFDNDSVAFVARSSRPLLAGRQPGREAVLGGLGSSRCWCLRARRVGCLLRSRGPAFAACSPGAVVAGLVVRLRREREIVLRGRTNACARSRSVGPARARERSRIARELHDVVSHAISVTVLQARGPARLASDPERTRAALDAIEQTNTSALGDMRRLLAVLRDTEPRAERRRARAAADAGAPRRARRPRPRLRVACRRRCRRGTPAPSRPASTSLPTASSRRRSPTCSSTPGRRRPRVELRVRRRTP